MPRPMIRAEQKNQVNTDNLLSATFNQEQKKGNQQMDAMVVDRILRQSRSKKYMDYIHSLDSGGHVHNENAVREIMQMLQEEFPELDISGMLLGFVSKCYLGDPYEVHSVDVIGNIIEHYPRGVPMPNGLEKARAIAMCGSYDVIEVYSNCCRAISPNGGVSVINC